MRSSSLILGICASSLFSASVFAAGDKAVNCRDEVTGQQAVYTGTASCEVYVGAPEFFVTLSRYFPPTTSPIATISELKNVNGSTRTLQCSASIPFSHHESVTSRVCDYTPKAFLTVDNFSIGEVYVSARGSDRDGTYTVKLLVNGVEQNNDSVLLSVFNGTIQFGEVVNVKSVVTDNDGYTTIKSSSFHIEQRGDINPWP